MKTNEFIAKIGEFARQDMQKSGILASLTIAQAIDESAWGKQDCGANNLFGIKGDYNGAFVVCDTKEWDNTTKQYVWIKAPFRKYPSWAESLQDHSDFLLNVHLGDGSLRYQAVIGETDYKKACHAIKDAGYATGPVYAESLIGIIEDFELYKFDKPQEQPQATQQATQPQQENYIIYKVQPNNSWWQIAQDKLGNGNRYMELVRFNGFVEAPTIHAGDLIKIPCEQAQPQPAQQPKPQNPYPLPTRNLLKSSVGADVKWLQNQLNSKGFACGAIDGIWGNQTEKAVRDFQRSKGLAVDGIAGKITISYLK